jgi:glycosyltransferase involved in cell wall biosynthesis
MVPVSLRKAARVITYSRAVRNDLIQVLGVPKEKIAVVPLGVDTRFFSRRTQPEVDAICCRHRITPPYLLYIGTVEPRKNLPMLLRAFARATEKTGAPHRLVMAGRPGWGAARVEAEIERLALGDQVARLGYVEAEDLPGLYSGAEAVLFPSLYEGFGLPALEAMACETPLFCSDTAALAEVAGDVGPLLAATDESVWTEALVRLLEPPSGRARAARRRTMGERGRARALRYSWEATARRTRAVYEEVAR